MHVVSCSLETCLVGLKFICFPQCMPPFVLTIESKIAYNKIPAQQVLKIGSMKFYEGR